LELVFIGIHDADTENQFFSIVIIEYTVQVISKS